MYAIFLTDFLMAFFYFCNRFSYAMAASELYILGIESSCDDTAAAVLNRRNVLSNCIANQSIHKAYGGVVPELASRAHQSHIVPVVQQAIDLANIDKNQLSAVAYTRGPGLLGSLLVGSAFAKSLSLALQIPLLEINHMQAHLLAHFIDHPDLNAPEFPFLGITLSGGHTQLVLVQDYFDMELVGTTLDDAIGEAFDKCGKYIGLDYPAGPHIDRLSKKGNPNRFDFPIPKVPGFDISYSGIKTAFINFVYKETQKDTDFILKHRNDLCASLQNRLVKIVMQKIERAVVNFKIKRVVIGGGVSANSEMRKQLKEKQHAQGWQVHLPPFEYTTDNAAMIGIAGYYKWQQKVFGKLTSSAMARLDF